MQVHDYGHGPTFTVCKSMTITGMDRHLQCASPWLQAWTDIYSVQVLDYGHGLTFTVCKSMTITGMGRHLQCASPWLQAWTDIYSVQVHDYVQASELAEHSIVSSRCG